MLCDLNCQDYTQVAPDWVAHNFMSYHIVCIKLIAIYFHNSRLLLHRNQQSLRKTMFLKKWTMTMEQSRRHVTIWTTVPTRTSPHFRRSRYLPHPMLTPLGPWQRHHCRYPIKSCHLRSSRCLLLWYRCFCIALHLLFGYIGMIVRTVVFFNSKGQSFDIRFIICMANIKVKSNKFSVAYKSGCCRRSHCRRSHWISFRGGTNFPTT